MHFGLNEQSLKVKPTYSGQRARCQFCNGVLIGKCGEIYKDHWQHGYNPNCDPWKEHETQWHRDWKSHFPESWQEVIIIKDNEKHIADVQIPSGKVIEFQNSSISSSTIRIREFFYENMIWVINAEHFKESIKIRSVVNRTVSEINRNTAIEKLNAREEYDYDLELASKRIEKIIRDLQTKSIEIERCQYKLEKLKEELNAPLNFTNSVINTWSDERFYWDDFTNEITDIIDSESKELLASIPRDIKLLKEEINTNQATLITISALKSFLHNGINYKKVPFENITSSNFSRVIAISKASTETFFPEVVDFKSEIEFKNMKYRHNNFVFGVDPDFKINSIKERLGKSKNKLQNLEERLPKLKTKVADELKANLVLFVEKAEKNYELLIQELKTLTNQQIKFEAERDDLLRAKAEFTHNSNREIEQRKKFDTRNAMIKNKGLYTYIWKHERKSWRAGSTAMYFDIGETYLFEKIKEGLFRKVQIDDFLNMHLLNR